MFLKFILFFLSLMVTATLCVGQSIMTGMVVKIADGDTMTLLDGNKVQHRIRLHGIDCPEKKQDFSQKATDHLSRWCYNKTVRVEVLDKDRYGRLIGRVWSNGVDVNLTLLKEGLAWHYKHFDKSKEYAQAEAFAKKKRLNIWSHPSPIAPWDFRRKKRK